MRIASSKKSEGAKLHLFLIQIIPISISQRAARKLKKCASRFSIEGPPEFAYHSVVPEVCAGPLTDQQFPLKLAEPIFEV